MAKIGETCCTKCGYELMGIQQRGWCPECGNSYDMRTGRGVGPRQQIDISERVIHWIVFGCFLVAGISVMICGGIMSLGAKDPSKPIRTGLVVGGVLVGLAGLKWVTKKYEYKPEDEEELSDV